MPALALYVGISLGDLRYMFHLSMSFTNVSAAALCVWYSMGFQIERWRLASVTMIVGSRRVEWLSCPSRCSMASKPRRVFGWLYTLRSRNVSSCTVTVNAETSCEWK